MGFEWLCRASRSFTVLLLSGSMGQECLYEKPLSERPAALLSLIRTLTQL
jgi:hypothetical protein